MACTDAGEREMFCAVSQLNLVSQRRAGRSFLTQNCSEVGRLTHEASPVIPADSHTVSVCILLAYREGGEGHDAESACFPVGHWHRRHCGV